MSTDRHPALVTRPGSRQAGAHRLRVHVLVCVCARCLYSWLVAPPAADLDALPHPPDRCPGCKAPLWWRPAGPVGRPPKQDARR